MWWRGPGVTRTARSSKVIRMSGTDLKDHAKLHWMRLSVMEKKEELTYLVTPMAPSLTPEAVLLLSGIFYVETRR